MSTNKPTNGIHVGPAVGDLPPLASMGALPGAGLKFDHPAPEGAAKTTSQVLGEITWLMSQSAIHKQMLIADLEWLVMVPMLMQQFRLYYDSGIPATAGPSAGGPATGPGQAGHPGASAGTPPKPIGVVFWAEVDADVADRLAAGVSKLRTQDWTSGSRVPEAQRQLWVVEVIAPFGGHEDIVRELKAAVFPGRELRYTKVTAAGKSVGVV